MTARVPVLSWLSLIEVCLARRPRTASISRPATRNHRLLSGLVTQSHPLALVWTSHSPMEAF